MTFEVLPHGVHEIPVHRRIHHGAPQISQKELYLAANEGRVEARGTAHGHRPATKRYNERSAISFKLCILIYRVVCIRIYII